MTPADRSQASSSFRGPSAASSRRPDEVRQPMLKVIGRSRQAQAGVYGTTVIPGPLRVGGQVTICP